MAKSDNPREIEVFAIFVHGMAFILHILGCIHNWMRKNWLQFFVHAFVAAFDLTSTFEHKEALKKNGSNNGSNKKVE